MDLISSPELSMLVRACRPKGDRGVAARSETRPMRWDRLIEAARWHRLAPLLWRYLQEADVPAPQNVRDALRTETRDTAVRNVVLGANLDSVLATLAENDIPAMLLKGSALVRMVYPDAALRPMSDVDILIPSEAIRDAQRFVEQTGYRASGVSLGRDNERQLASHFHHFPLVSPNGALTIELHRHVTWAGSEFAISGFWERSNPGAGPYPHLVPSPEDLFLHLAIHFADDRVWRRPFGLGQLADLLWVADRWSLDWKAIVDRADAYALSDRVFLALMTVDHLAKGVVPTDLASCLKPASFRARAGEQFVIQRVLRPRHSMPLEYLARGHFRVRSGTTELAGYVGADELHPPSRRRLRVRRAVGLVRKILRALPTPTQLVHDLILSRWILTLRTGVSEKGRPSEAAKRSNPTD